MDPSSYARRQAMIRKPDIIPGSRMDRIIDYTPIDERGKPCLNDCGWFSVRFAGCSLYGGRIIPCVEKCAEYRSWMVSRFPDGEVGLARYLSEIKAAEAANHDK